MQSFIAVFKFLAYFFMTHFIDFISEHVLLLYIKSYFPFPYNAYLTGYCLGAVSLALNCSRDFVLSGYCPVG